MSRRSPAGSAGEPCSPAARSWHCYILECADGTLYTGITTDPHRRLLEHNRGLGAKYTRSRLPVQLLWTEPHPDRAAATRRELEIKRLPAATKRHLAFAGQGPAR